jgi:ectoine hydroxylase-related dioxygenase (phytanoyl-CoA dioxygenase family)
MSTTLLADASTGLSLPEPLSPAQVRQYREQGFCVVPNAISPAYLELLRGACQAAIERTNAEMDRQGTDTLGINHRNNRYFSCHPSLEHRQLFDFIYSPVQLAICRQLLGPEAFVFWEQYVVKAADKGMHFGWHQDSGYVGKETPHHPYLTCWCALDDMSEENGTISVLPYDRAGTRERVEHTAEAGTNDLIGYRGADPGVTVTCPAGSIALFSSCTFHRSGRNRTARWRRSYLIQYSDALILRPDGSPWGRTEPLLRGGRPVPPPAAG